MPRISHGKGYHVILDVNLALLTELLQRYNEGVRHRTTVSG